MKRISVGDNTVVIDEENKKVTTYFPDGTSLDAIPVYNDQCAATAQALGYGDLDDPIWAMTMDHDLAHTQVSVARGLPFSPTLHGVAIGQPASPNVVHEEECLAFLMQRISNGSLND